MPDPAWNTSASIGRWQASAPSIGAHQCNGLCRFAAGVGAAGSRRRCRGADHRHWLHRRRRYCQKRYPRARHDYSRQSVATGAIGAAVRLGTYDVACVSSLFTIATLGLPGPAEAAGNVVCGVIASLDRRRRPEARRPPIVSRNFAAAARTAARAGGGRSSLAIRAPRENRAAFASMVVETPWAKAALLIGSRD